MFKRSISVHLALMFALTTVLIVTAAGFVLRSSLHDSLQKQMHKASGMGGSIHRGKAL